MSLMTSIEVFFSYLNRTFENINRTQLQTRPRLSNPHRLQPIQHILPVAWSAVQHERDVIMLLMLQEPCRCE